VRGCLRNGKLYPYEFAAYQRTGEIETLNDADLATALGTPNAADNGKAAQNSIKTERGDEGEIVVDYQVNVNQVSISLTTGFTQPVVGANATITIPPVPLQRDRDLLNSNGFEFHLANPDGQLVGYFRTVGVGTVAVGADGTITATLLNLQSENLIESGDFDLSTQYGTGNYLTGAQLTGRTSIIPVNLNGSAFTPPTYLQSGHVQVECVVNNAAVDNAIADNSEGLKLLQARAALYSYVPAQLFQDLGPFDPITDGQVVYMTLDQARKVRFFGRGGAPNLVNLTVRWMTGDPPQLTGG
jgi:hypothetical protein